MALARTRAERARSMYNFLLFWPLFRNSDFGIEGGRRFRKNAVLRYTVVVRLKNSMSTFSLSIKSGQEHFLVCGHERAM